jgi:glutamyl-tRNA reductase
LPTSLYQYEGEAAVRHVMRVAAGLDSMVLGEPQILGQVKTAYSQAAAAGTLGPELERSVPEHFFHRQTGAHGYGHRR